MMTGLPTLLWTLLAAIASIGIIAAVTAMILRRRLAVAYERERALRESAEKANAAVRFQAHLLDSVGQAVIAIDQNAAITYLNQAGEELCGWSRAEALGKTVTDLMLPEGPKANVGFDATRALLKGQSWTGQATLWHRDGRKIPVLLVASPTFDEHGRPNGAVGIASDITERLRAAEEQRFLANVGETISASLDVQETLSEVARLAVPVLADYCFVDILYGDEVKRVGVAHRDPEREAVLEGVRKFPPKLLGDSPVGQVLRGGESVVLEFNDKLRDVLVQSDEHRFIIDAMQPQSWMIVPIRARGDTVGAISLIFERGQRTYGPRELNLAEELARRAAVALDNARLYQEAQAANQAKSDFLAVVSHELRTPLTTIMGYADLLLTGVPQTLPDGSRTYVERVRKAAWHLLSLIEQILIYARMEAGRDEVHPSRVELAELAKETATLIEPIAKEKGLAFNVTYPAPPSIIETDLTKVRQILLNLLSNAVKFTPEGEVRMDVEMRNGRAIFRVRDTGQGIAAEHLERIFDPFWQVEHATTRTIGGAGLGLSVTRRLARLLGGDVHVVTAPDAGSTFVVELPTRYIPETPAHS